MEKLVFMAGLPRSGSTLLGAILGQNPRFHTEPSSPVMDFVMAVNKVAEKNEHYAAYPKQQSVFAIIQSLFQSYYCNTGKAVVFDKNRGWPGQINGLEQCVVPKAKVLCPVRNIDEVLASFLNIANKNPFNAETGKLNFIDHSLLLINKPINDENRCELIMSDKGMIGQCMGAIQDAIKRGYRDRLHFIEYDNLVTKPEETLKAIYSFLEEDYFSHDLENIQNGNRERDSEVFSVPTLHEIGSKLNKSRTNPRKVLPERFYQECQGKEFWRSLDN
jgi:sulfotransferase